MQQIAITNQDAICCVSKIKSTGYNQALDHIQFIYNRLYIQGKLEDRCLSCPVLNEVNKLIDMSKELKIQELENELGYYTK